MFRFSQKIGLVALAAGFAGTGCQPKTSSQKMPADSTAAPVASRFAEGSFGYDVDFLKKTKGALLLTAPDNDSAQVVLAPALQGRVMTSTSSGPAGRSYGWMNYDLLRSGEFKPHINPYGGEERLWLAPEGGQFSVYFGPGEPFDFAHWQTPALIDTVAFEVKEATKTRAVFTKKATLTNHGGTELRFDVTRTVRTLSRADVRKLLGVQPDRAVKAVAYESSNELKNTGENWHPDTGLLAVWILGMMNASPTTTIVVPVQPDGSGHIALTDDYFGKVPAERLRVGEKVLFFKGDGKARTKIGVAPGSTRGVAGSFDGAVLTLIQFDVDPRGQYLKSTWEMHKNPFGGDAFNSYNDGPNETGGQMGQLYELESTSPTRALKTGERLTHRHRTFHFEGDRAGLDAIARAVLGVGLAEIEGGLK